jgi:hypothetical protein
MKFGPELDALIAARIFAQTVPVQCPPYSTDIAAAWLIVEEMLSRGLSVRVTKKPGDFPWHAYIDGKEGFQNSSQAQTAPRAICVAALLAHGVKV